MVQTGIDLKKDQGGRIWFGEEEEPCLVRGAWRGDGQGMEGDVYTGGRQSEG